MTALTGQNGLFEQVLAALYPDLPVVDLDEINDRPYVDLTGTDPVVRFSRIIRPKCSITAGSMRIWGAKCSLARSKRREERSSLVVSSSRRAQLEGRWLDHR